jgi:hypothetical protein
MAPFFLMPRVFESEMMLREDVVSAERMSLLRAFLKTLGIELPQLAPGTTVSQAIFAPVSLRWRVSPQIGVPRVPFEVWRRPLEKRGPHRSLPITVTVTTESTVEWGAQPLIELVITATPAAGGTLRLQALDDHLDPIVGEQVLVSAPQPVRFHTPNMCALRVTGNGTVSNLELFPMADYANDGGWELIETVGLPFHLHETPDPVYDSREQGFPSALRPGFEAAQIRLMIGFLMALPPHTTALDGLPAPGWPAPNLGELLVAMRDAPNSPLQLIREMLETVDPSSFDQAQIGYRRSIPTPGFSQPGTGASSEPGTADLAVGARGLGPAAPQSW